MPTKDIPLGAGAYQHQSLPFSAQRSVNMYPSVTEATDGSLAPAGLFFTWGIKAWTTANITGQVNRGLYFAADILFAVNGGQLYRISEAGTATALGSISGSDKVIMADNGTQLVVVVPSTGNGYVYNMSTAAFTAITDPDYTALGAKFVVFKDGYFVFITKDGTKIFHSELNDGTVFGALDFATAEVNPDKNTALLNFFNELHVLGRESVEVFENTASAAFAFTRINGYVLSRGCIASRTVVLYEDAYLFLGSGKDQGAAIFSVNFGSRPAKISTDAIDSELENFLDSELADAYAVKYSHSGRVFIAFTVKSTREGVTDRTFVYDVNTSAALGGKVWHERTSTTGESWRVTASTRAYGRIVVGDSETNNIGELDGNTYLEYSDHITRLRTLAPLRVQNNWVSWNRMDIQGETGVGATSGQGSDPIIQLRFSDDGNRNFSLPIFGSLGALGAYDFSLRFEPLGYARSARTYEIMSTEPVRQVWSNAVVNFTKGDAG